MCTPSSLITITSCAPWLRSVCACALIRSRYAVSPWVNDSPIASIESIWATMSEVRPMKPTWTPPTVFIKVAGSNDWPALAPVVDCILAAIFWKVGFLMGMLTVACSTFFCIVVKVLT